MGFDTRGFRTALGSFSTGIVVVTAGRPELYRGITVNSFTSLSLDPPLVLWCIARTSRRYETFTMASEFTVSVLGEGQRAAAERIAVAGEGDLGDIALEPVEGGPPAIAGSLAVFSHQTLHRSGANTTKNMRRVYLAQYSCAPILNRHYLYSDYTETGARADDVAFFARRFLRNGKVDREDFYPVREPKKIEARSPSRR